MIDSLAIHVARNFKCPYCDSSSANCDIETKKIIARVHFCVKKLWKICHHVYRQPIRSYFRDIRHVVSVVSITILRILRGATKMWTVGKDMTPINCIL